MKVKAKPQEPIVAEAYYDPFEVASVEQDDQAEELFTPEEIKATSPLVYDLMVFIRRYVVMSRPQLLVVALWIMHTHAIEAFEQTPYLAVTSPEKQCGKTRLLEVLELLVARPWKVVAPSEAVMYRYIHASMPTLLLDEVDTIFNPRTQDRYEPHRTLLNAGHRRGTTVPRMNGVSSISEFRVFCAKVLAGIGTLPDTVADRSIPIRLQRRKGNEKVKDFRLRYVQKPGGELLDRVKAWVEEHKEALAKARPKMPTDLSDRMQEGCEPLVAMADLLRCGAAARAALVSLLGGERLDDQDSMRLRLLRDIKVVFEQKGNPPGLRSTDLIDHLCDMEEEPWEHYFGHRLEPKDLASLLRHYGIKSISIRVKGQPVIKGYKRASFHDAWSRYVKPV